MFNVFSFVAAAVRKNAVLDNPTESRIGEITRDWFKYARDRDGGRKRRENKTKNSQEKPT